jgi:hypothetical protein
LHKALLPQQRLQGFKASRLQGFKASRLPLTESERAAAPYARKEKPAGSLSHGRLCSLFFSAMRYKAQGFPKGKALSLISHSKKRKGGGCRKESRGRTIIKKHYCFKKLTFR